jgi:hypothetical protein
LLPQFRHLDSDQFESKPLDWRATMDCRNGTWARRAACGAAALVCLTAAVAAQPVSPAPRVRDEGLFDSIGRFFEQGADHVRNDWRRATDKATADRKDFDEQAAEVRKNAAEATKSAVDSVAKLPTSRVVDGRERCGLAPNGAPDCLSAATALCRKNGFGTGKSMDFTSAEECPPRAYLPGQPPSPELACKTITFISRAMCQ